MAPRIETKGTDSRNTLGGVENNWEVTGWFDNEIREGSEDIFITLRIVGPWVRERKRRSTFPCVDVGTGGVDNFSFVHLDLRVVVLQSSKQCSSAAAKKSLWLEGEGRGKEGAGIIITFEIAYRRKPKSC